jgi:hypothetical protein
VLEAKSLEEPESERVFLDGSVRGEVRVGRDVIGRGVYRPGWRWSEHVRPQTGSESSAHTGYVVSGRMAVRAPDGTEAVVEPGGAFYAAPGHDAWVVGDEPCVALDFATG